MVGPAVPRGSWEATAGRAAGASQPPVAPDTPRAGVVRPAGPGISTATAVPAGFRTTSTGLGQPAPTAASLTAAAGMAAATWSATADKADLPSCTAMAASVEWDFQ